MQADALGRRALTRRHRRGQPRSPTWQIACILLLTLGLWNASCADDAADNEQINEFTPEPDDGTRSSAHAMSLAAPSACITHTECAPGFHCLDGVCSYECSDAEPCPSGNCSERGICGEDRTRDEDTDVDGTRPDEPATVTRDGAPRGALVVHDAVVYARPGHDRVSVRVHIPESAGQARFRIDRTDAREFGIDERFVYRLNPGEHQLDLAAGAAHHALDEPQEVILTFIDANGRYDLTISPTYPVSGHYIGQVQVAELGHTPIPIEMELHTSPPNASLREADEAWIRLPVDRAALFSPGLREHETRTWITRPLLHEAVSGRWVGQFEFTYALDGHLLTLPNQEPRALRTMRVEIAPSETRDVLVGRIVDRWTGLAHRLNTAGAVEHTSSELVGVVTFERQGAHDNGAIVVDELESLSDQPGRVDMASFCVPSGATRINPCADVDNASAVELDACIDLLVTQSSEHFPITRIIDEHTDATSGVVDIDEMATCLADSRPGDGCGLDEGVLECVLDSLTYLIMNVPGETAIHDRALQSFQALAAERAIPDRIAILAAEDTLRLRWLQASEANRDAAGGRNATRRVLDAWDADVLSRSRRLLRRSFDERALLLVGHTSRVESAMQARGTILFEMAEQWRTHASALTLYAQRANAVITQDSERARRAEELDREVVELYVMAAMLRSLHTRTGHEHRNAGLAAEFAAAVTAVHELSLDFEDLVYRRDAEVVLTRSLEPNANAASLLPHLEHRTLDRVARSLSAVDAVHAEVAARRLTEAQLRNQYENLTNDILDELVATCGIPIPCDRADALECRPFTEIGLCGFLTDGVDYFDDDEGVTPSEAGQAILAIRSATLALLEAEEEFAHYLLRTELAVDELYAFAADIEEWNTLRMLGVETSREALQAMSSLRHQGVIALRDNLDAQDQRRRQGIYERDQINSQIQSLCLDGVRATGRYNDLAVQTRAQMIARSQSNIEAWNELRVGQAHTTYDRVLGDILARAHANKRSRKKSRAGRWIQGIAAVAQVAVGVLGAPLTGGASASLVVNGVSTIGQLASGKRRDNDQVHRELHRERLVAAESFARELLDAELTLARDQAALDDRGQEYTLEQARDALNLEREVRQCETRVLEMAASRSRDFESIDLAALHAEYAVSAAQRDAAIQDISSDLHIERDRQAADLAYRQELAELRRRQSSTRELLAASAAIEVRVMRAELAVEEAITAYERIVGRASATSARLDRAFSQRAEISSILSSPVAFARRGAALEHAERSVGIAREAMMDWLVGIEYYALRPFADRREQILTATSPHQLDAIAIDLQNLTRACGGPTNSERIELSVRNDLLRMTRPIHDPVLERDVSAAERFRDALASAHITVDRSVRFDADRTLHESLSGNADILAVTFSIDLEAFANLGLACGARWTGVGVSLVGNIGNGTPSVALIADGTARIRSCQADIERIVENQGGSRTGFGSVSTFRTHGQSAVPIATLNAAPDPTRFNQTLEGRALAGRYSIVIPRAAGSNAELDWSQLEDIVLYIDYTYQDFFPPGACR